MQKVLNKSWEKSLKLIIKYNILRAISLELAFCFCYSQYAKVISRKEDTNVIPVKTGIQAQ